MSKVAPPTPGKIGGQPTDGFVAARRPQQDLLAYMADLIDELRAMAEDQRLGTLAGLLAVAQREAILQSESCTGPGIETGAA